MMDWANERYVRLFVRDTTTWKLLPWQSRALLALILRKLDRSGVIDIGEDGEAGLAAVVEVPPDFLQSGLPDLLRREVFKMAGGKFVMPNFMAAQEAKQSDAQRKRESRENQRLSAMRSQPVTDGHTLSESQPVTGCPPASVLVTPDQTSPDPSASLPTHVLEASGSDQSNSCAKTGYDWLSYFNARYFQVRGKQRGCASDAKASANLGDLLVAQPEAERSEDWGARERIVDEFLARADRATQEAGWKFAFFVASFDGLRIAPEKRPKQKPGQQQGPAPYRWPDLPGANDG